MHKYSNIAFITINISENITLNGVTYGNTISKTFQSQGEVIQRIMSITTKLQNIFIHLQLMVEDKL